MPGRNTTVHVVGTGTIGEPLIALLLAKKDDLGIDQVSFSKRTAGEKDTVKVRQLIKKGGVLAADEGAVKDFEACGQPVSLTLDEALQKANVVIDCTSTGGGLRHKEETYGKYEDSTLGFVAQGSEFGFGKMYARGINDEALSHGVDKYVQVVSCNTHNLAVLIKTIGFDPDGDVNLEEARFVCMRRANDISQDSSFVPSPEVGKHKDERFGTHHARDAWHLFQTLGLDLNLYSSAVKLNSQYMHTLQFHLRLKRPLSRDEVVNRLRANARIAVTNKTSANSVFSFGRDHGLYGRIYNQTVVSIPTLAVHGRDVVGFCFTPQDGNSILSTVAIIEWLANPQVYEERIRTLREYFFEEI
jgi:glyceraldehyde-3-phosphate dehydrogenase (NAD(P))